jgi:Glycosyltransferases, probably involved in cell wall biogenesis
MNQDHLVTAIVSAYKSSAFLPGCLENLLGQSLGHRLEVIVVNSGSPENESEIVRRYQADAPNLKLIETPERETIYAAWNRAAAAATGRYAVNTNTDDRLRADALERMSALLESDPGCGVVYIDQVVTRKPFQSFENHTPYRDKIREDFVRERAARMNPCGPQVMWRRDLHDAVGYFRDDYEVAGDWDFWMRVAFETDFTVRRLPERLGLYYLNMEGLECGPRKQKQRLREIEEIRARYGAVEVGA